jgi:hypothetical protein
MPRQSRADLILENHPEEIYKPRLVARTPGYILYYFFEGKTSTRFYEALEKLKEKVVFSKLGRNVLLAQEINDIYSLTELILLYRGKVHVFKAFKINHVEPLVYYRKRLSKSAREGYQKILGARNRKK